MELRPRLALLQDHDPHVSVARTTTAAQQVAVVPSPWTSGSCVPDRNDGRRTP